MTSPDFTVVWILEEAAVWIGVLKPWERGRLVDGWEGESRVEEGRRGMVT